jgi:hypothetical protein
MAVPNYMRCITAVETAAGRALKEDELEAIFSRLHGRARRYAQQGMNDTDALLRASRELGDDMKLAGIIEKRNQLINAARRREIEMRVREGAEATDLRRIINETDSKAHGLTAEIFGPMMAALRKEGLDRVLAAGDKAFDRAVIRELWSIESSGKSVTGNAQARRAAELINEAQERARVMQNAAGAWIGKREHYVSRQSHSMEKVRGDGTPNAFARWRDYILPRLDDTTFDSLDEVTPKSVDEFLLSTWKAISSGIHDTTRGQVKYGDVGAATGPGNLAKRVSQERKLIFKDGDAWADYNQEFGRGTLMDAVRGGLENGAKNTALMRVWGPNPEAMHDTITKAAAERARDRADFAAVDALKAKTNERYFSILTGSTSIDANMKAPLVGLTYGQITAAVQAQQTLSKLGGVVLASVPDFASNVAVLRHNGVPLFEAYFTRLTSFLPKSAEAREISDLSGAGIDSMLGNIASRFSGMDAVRGRSAKLVDIFHKINLLSWWTDSLKGGLGTILTHNLGRRSGQSFDQLPSLLQTTLGRFQITAADWDIARGFAAKAADGRDYVLPAHIENDAVRSKFFDYVTYQIRDAMNEPNLFAKNATTFGTQAGTPEGMAARLIMQFKTYPLTFMSRVREREIRGPNGVDVFGLAHLIVATSLLGYASMELKNLARGRDPRTANTREPGEYAKLVFASMMQGGGFGLYGDFLFGDTSRMGGGPVTSLFGPTVGSLDDLGKQIQTLRKWTLEGDKQAGRDFRSGAVGLVRDNTPFVNLFYTRAALDYFVIYRLQEALNPGYLARYEERMRRENQTTFMLSPTNSPYR